MIQTIPIEKAKRNLDELLEPLHLGDTITLTDERGEPTAVVVSLKPPRAENTRVNWNEWEKLADEIGRAWKDNKSAIETIAEMRR